MGMIRLLAAPIRSIVRFPLFQLAVVVGIILLLQAADDDCWPAKSSTVWTDLLMPP